eukprot:gnl/TRDRNA2_/TRDRNA2_170596_c0_seq29.p1 gnl/TRDRNA2_/TRDRNA2_170596_c0~~gnl/TRDRNA2_/TRDRNA2_170596_c0_seq29.p1  ORF type:complete len:468 (+),score=170.99 gnl/TRDRNA2_/TRDRNA2_170596_c0_seq29:134-1537(+)
MYAKAFTISLLLAIAGAAEVEKKTVSQAEVFADLHTFFPDMTWWLHEEGDDDVHEDTTQLVQPDELNEQPDELKESIAHLHEVIQQAAKSLKLINTKTTEHTDSALLQTNALSTAEIKTDLQSKLIRSLVATMDSIDSAYTKSSLSEEMHDRLLSTVEYGEDLVDRLGKDGEESDDEAEDEEDLSVKEDDLSLLQEMTVASSVEKEEDENNDAATAQELTEEDLDLDKEDLQASRNLLQSSSTELHDDEADALLQEGGLEEDEDAEVDAEASEETQEEEHDEEDETDAATSLLQIASETDEEAEEEDEVEEEDDLDEAAEPATEQHDEGLNEEEHGEAEEAADENDEALLQVDEESDGAETDDDSDEKNRAQDEVIAELTQLLEDLQDIVDANAKAAKKASAKAEGLSEAQEDEKAEEEPIAEAKEEEQADEESAGCPSTCQINQGQYNRTQQVQQAKHGQCNPHGR